ncbi:MAG: HDIG domain-containing protein [Acidimicrobiia bacterium]|nr:HDIG domain-containing protein [Acidimicrobiia bacterium]
MELDAALLQPGPHDALWAFVGSPTVGALVPELLTLRLEQDPAHRHKDVLAHTIAVVSKTSPRLRLRLAALFHDIGKPTTRRFDRSGVTFHHHEEVGARMTGPRLLALGYDDQLAAEVSELVGLSGRFKGYEDSWSDAAVRRYARDAGHLLGDLNELVRCDCTTRHRDKARRLQAHVDDVERRIASLAAQERQRAERPAIDGVRVMELLEVPPGPEVGAALTHLLRLKRTSQAMTAGAAEAELLAWWTTRKHLPDTSGEPEPGGHPLGAQARRERPA